MILFVALLISELVYLKLLLIFRDLRIPRDLSVLLARDRDLRTTRAPQRDFFRIDSLAL